MGERDQSSAPEHPAPEYAPLRFAVNGLNPVIPGVAAACGALVARHLRLATRRCPGEGVPIARLQEPR